MRAIIGIVVLICTSTSSADLPPAEHKIFRQPNSPIKILRYEAECKESHISGRYVRDEVHHKVAFLNISSQKAVAVKINLLSFNVLNEFMHRESGYAVTDMSTFQLMYDPNNPSRNYLYSTKGTWIANLAEKNSNFYLGAAYISKVRFEDGKIWVADSNSIAKQVRAIDSSLAIEIIRKF